MESKILLPVCLIGLVRAMIVVELISAEINHLSLMVDW